MPVDQSLKASVCVVIPVRDRRALLDRCLSALDAQTSTDFDVVVVDDGSTDGSVELARSRTVQGRPVTVMEQPARGAVAARTLAIDATDHPFIAFTDSDCEPAPGWLAAAAEALEGGADVVAGPTRPTRHRRPLERSLWVDDTGLYPTCNVAYRRRALVDSGGFDVGLDARWGFRPGRRAKHLGFGEDTLLAWRVRRAGRAAWRDDMLVHHAVFPPDLADQLSRTSQAAGFPALVSEVPELRDTFLRHGVLLGTSRVPLWCAVVGACLRRPLPTAAALAWWLVGHWRGIRRAEASRKRSIAALPVLAATDLLTAAALLVGSIRARRLVL